MNCGRVPTRPGLAKSRIAQRSPRPFSIGVPVSAMRVRAGIRRSCCDVSLAGFLIACASSRTTRAHVDRGDRVDVAHRGAVGRDHHVGVGDLGRDLVGRGAVRAVVHDDAQPRREARGFRGPVADDRRRRDHQRRPVASAGEQVREHRRRLAETHVEREAAAEPDRVEEAEPRQRLGLVAAQLADESVRRARGLGRDRRRRRRAGRPPSRRRRSRCRPASGESSRPSASRSISAPDSCFVSRVRRARRPRP